MKSRAAGTRTRDAGVGREAGGSLSVLVLLWCAAKEERCWRPHEQGWGPAMRLRIKFHGLSSGLERDGGTCGFGEHEDGVPVSRKGKRRAGKEEELAPAHGRKNSEDARQRASLRQV